MQIGQLLHQFVAGQDVQSLLLVIIVDVVLGVAAAVKMKTFRLSYLGNFARNDLLGKVLPFFVINSAAIVAGGTDLVIPGLDVNVLKDAMYVGLMGAMVGSVIGSLRDLGFTWVPVSAGSPSSG